MADVRTKKQAGFPKELSQAIFLKKEHLHLPPTIIGSSIDEDFDRQVRKYNKEYDVRFQAYVTAEFQKKFALLFRHYGISQASPNAWMMLAFNLALDGFPGGFQVRPPSKTAVTQIWAADTLALLWHDVEVRRRKNMTVEDACGELLGVKPWCEILAQDYRTQNRKSGKSDPKVATLVRHYNASQKSEFVRLYKNMREQAKRKGLSSLPDPALYFKGLAQTVWERLALKHPLLGKGKPAK